MSKVVAIWQPTEGDPQTIHVMLTREEMAYISKKHGVPITLVLTTFLETELGHADR